MPRFEDVEIGQQVPARVERLDQRRLIRYAGASGDYNPLHWDPGFAEHVSPTKGVIAHGMLNMGIVSAVVTEWAGGPEKVARLTANFRAPCPVGSIVTYGAEVIALDPEARTATLSVWAELSGGERVVDRRTSRAVVRLD
ncbi:MAG: MaoC/PaaZ C-terminal domain-containing protein [Egibacteraceae bacterium]